MLTNLYFYRRYLLGSFWTEFRYRYAGTALGLFWFIGNPLLEALVYSLVFSYMVTIKSGGVKGVSYTIFLLTGLFPWLAFSHLLTRGSNSINIASSYLRRLSISSDIFVAKEALISMLSLFIYTLILLVLIPIFGTPLSWTIILSPILIFLFIVMGFGISLSLSHLRVFFPDVGEVLGVLIHLWRWTLPINYSYDIFPESVRAIFKFNPPYFFIESIRNVLLEGRAPSLEAWLHMFGWVVFFWVTGSLVAKLLGPDVKDQL